MLWIIHALLVGLLVLELKVSHLQYPRVQTNSNKPGVVYHALQLAFGILGHLVIYSDGVVTAQALYVRWHDRTS